MGSSMSATVANLVMDLSRKPLFPLPLTPHDSGTDMWMIAMHVYRKSMCKNSMITRIPLAHIQFIKEVKWVYTSRRVEKTTTPHIIIGQW